ncbi:MAG: hypothetical protein AMJ81_10460 [Phycisphaerae bacterium SM23_33]|nr:MAG: hypothetical protein AMJ81_10460 [Phycisphaerae bacterium SM23_33]
MAKKAAFIVLAGLMVFGCGGDEGRAPAAPATAAGPAQAGQAALKPQRGLMQVVIVEKGPPIDGTLGSPVWAKCPPLPLGECTTDKPGPLKTTARVLFDATRLYVAWQCQQPETDKLTRSVTQRDGDVWKDDCVELFVTGDQRVGYFHFIVNPAGTLFDARTRGSVRDERSWDSSAKVAAAITPSQGWTVTLSVPLAELGAYVGTGQTWIMNLNRTVPGPTPSSPAAEWSWAIMGSNDYHQVLDYGQIRGVNVPRREDGVTRTASPPPPPPSYDKGSPAGSVVVYHRFGDVDIPDGGQGPAREFPVRIQNSAGLKLAFLARGDGGVDRVPLNMFDQRAKDNTTSKAYREFLGGAWLPVIYFCDRFRYNAVVESTVAGSTDYSNVRFHGSATPGGKGVLHLRDFVIYRGEDTTAPPAPAGLKAKAGGEGVRLTWNRVADNTGIATYVISRAGEDGGFAKLAESALPEHLDRPRAAGTYRYRVLAADFEDNLSGWSKEVSARAAGGFEQPKPTELETDRAAYAEHVRRIHAAGAGKVKKGLALAFGDSLTYATNYGAYIEAFLGRYRVAARGYPGQRTGFGRGRIEQDLAAVNPEFCLILLGTNNGKSEKEIAAAMDDLLAMAASCEKRGSVPVIATIPPRGFKDPQSRPEAGYNAALVKTCRANRIPICYLFEEFQAQPDRTKLLASDGVHWAGEGFPLTGKVWKKAMDQVGFVLLDRPE